MSSQINVDTIVDKAGTGGANVKIANTSTYVSDGGAVTQDTLGGLCKAWISFRGTSTVSIRDSVNNASVTDNGTGDYGINFTNNMNNALYCVSYGGTHDGGAYWSVGTIDYDATNNGIATSAYTTNYMDHTNNVRDTSYCHETVFGDLA